MRPSVRCNFLRLTLFWGLCFSRFAVKAEVNITVDDSNVESISYHPAVIGFWSSNSESCSLCFHPDLNLAFNQTFHFGRHIISVDEDDLPSNSLSPSSASSAPTSPSATPTSPSATPTSPSATSPPQPTTSSPSNANEGDSDDEGDDGDDDGGSKGGGRGPSKRRQSKDIRPRLDADDPGFIDSVVNVQFKFKGTAVYLYGIEPLFLSTSPLSPSSMNLTFTLDNVPSGRFFHNGSSSSPTDFASNVLVFSQTDLDDKPHVLLVTLQPESIFIFDYMVYTSTDETLSPSPNGTAQSSGPSKHNIATFAGAIGGSAGALGTLSLCIFLSICRRRRLAARRERRQRRLHDPEETSSDGSSGRRTLLPSSSRGPRMIGPRPFIPRYFPGTVPPPPSYGDPCTPYSYSDPDDIDAISAPGSITTNDVASSPTTTVSTATQMTHAGLPILTIPSAPPPVYIPSPITLQPHPHSPTSPSLALASTSYADTGSEAPTALRNYADIPPNVPPPSEDQLEIPLTVEDPPSFGEAISTPPASPVMLLPRSEPTPLRRIGSTATSSTSSTLSIHPETAMPTQIETQTR